MEIKYLKLIKTIVEEGSIANSTNKLFLTQSALSKQLKELETYLGFKVFFRTRNKWELSDEGEELYKMACTIFKNIEKGFKNIEEIQRGSSGTVKVSTECHLFYHGLSSLIQKMGLLYPEINIDLAVEATYQPVPKLLSHDIDIAIVTEKPNNELLSSIEVNDDELFMLIHKEHPLNKVAFIETKHLYDCHLIIHSFPLETVSVYQKFLKPNKIDSLKVTAIPLTEIALEMVSANLGIMSIPKWALQLFKLPEELVFKKISKHGLKRTHYLVMRKSDTEKKYMNDFISNFQEHVKNKF